MRSGWILTRLFPTTNSFLLFPFFYSTSSLIYIFSSPPLALPSGLRSFAFGSDWMPKSGWAALVWAGFEKAAAVQQQLKHMHML